MVLQRYTRHVDGTIPIAALLYNDEELLASQDNTGIYDGPNKSPLHQDGTVHATTHRLFFIDARLKHTHLTSFALDLAHVKYTTHYAGLFTSSPKVTLLLAAAAPSAQESSESPHRSASAGSDQDAPSGWECEVCGEKNAPGLSPAAAQVCSLCGVRRSAVPVQMHSQDFTSSSSLPSALPSPSHSPAPTPAAPPSSSSSKVPNIACTACTFLNHPSLQDCEVCATPLPRPHALPSTGPGRSALTAKSAPATRAVSPAPPGELDPASSPVVKLSFRRGGDKAFYAELKRGLLRKAWLSCGQGAAGIMRTAEISAMDTAQGMSDALMDLETLRVQARDMVRLAAELNERLTAVSAAPGTPSPHAPAPEPEEATFIRSSLAQLGLQMQNAPVTHDMVRDERRWLDELARELAGVLVGSSDARTDPNENGKETGTGTWVRAGDKAGAGAGMMRARGIVALDEVWGGWNRARGVALIPPATLLAVLPRLVFHTDPRAHVAREEGLTVGLAGEMIEDAERAGAVWWYPDVFAGYTWDGQDD
ncbi:hypothetical protein FIBSPDRAFT_908791 [Athelia psychrophila]|uniref:Vacuolar protein-sorting-associated protein 36 n=1 Tax=Athelia psychrophila TaxID=1759441 RepID=A0A166R554_9AGAM|nr:hypothetical protein FIBSPDRAFT_908791 [Fibularhizoctonia sp. CBS 109695]